MPELAALASELRLAIYRMTRRMRQQHPTHDLTLTQVSALAIIWRDGPIAAGELAIREQVRAPSITRVINSLEDAGIVRRTQNSADRRQVLIEITDEGVRQADSYVQAREAWLTERLLELSVEDRDVLRRAAAIFDGLATSRPAFEEGTAATS